jgi:hypothetical protein
MTRAAAALLLIGATTVVGFLTRSLLFVSPGAASVSSGSLVEAVTTVCSVALVLSWGWFLLATAACLVDELRAARAGAGAAAPRRPARRDRPPTAARRLARVLAGSGLTCLAAPCLPATYALAPDDLPLPTRQLGTAAAPRTDAALPARRPPAAPTGAGAVVVRPGDTLWSIAASRLAPQAPAAAVDEAWRRLYALNRSSVGPDPDLIHPGTRLRTP